MNKVQEIENILKNTLMKQSTFEAVMEKTGLTRKQVIQNIKKSPILFWIHTAKINKELREKIFLVDNNTRLYPTGEIGDTDTILSRMREDRQNRMFKQSFIECENVSQLIGTWMYKYKSEMTYLTFKELFKQYWHLFAQYDVANKNLFYVTRRKVANELRSIGLVIDKP